MELDVHSILPEVTTLVAKIELLHEAEKFIKTSYVELGKAQVEIEARLIQVSREIHDKNHYEHTVEELEHGARQAWRNSNKCIGRLFWNSLHVVDKRIVETEEDVFDALVHHIYSATNHGKIRPTITLFKPYMSEQNHIRIWNHQLIRYAGYETEEGVIGDPASIAFTKVCEGLGWNGERSHHDLLPIVIGVDGKSPKWFELPKELILEVSIEHPEINEFKDLNMKWYAVPIISDMSLEIGGVTYTAAPFNGWYMGTEVGARNLADEHRYNFLPKVASVMGLNTRTNASLWKDKALLELNVAVLHSYKNAGVSIVDHHTAAQQFKRFEQNESECGRQLTGDWTWLIPPLSPATTNIFHKSYKNEQVKPTYNYQSCPFHNSVEG